MVTIQQALQAGDATPDELTLILDVLARDGFTRDKPAGQAFTLLDVEDYRDTLNKYQRKLILAAQLPQGGGAGVLLLCLSWQVMSVLARQAALAESRASWMCWSSLISGLPNGAAACVNLTWWEWSWERSRCMSLWATQALYSVQSLTSQQAAPGAKLREWDSPGQSPSTWGPLKGLGGLEEKQHALGDALGGHWGKPCCKVLVFHFGLCLTLWLCALQVPSQIYPRGGCSCWCKLCRQLCLSCKSWNKPFSSPQLLSCQSQQL